MKNERLKACKVKRIYSDALISHLGFGLNGICAAVLVSRVVASVAAAITGTVIVKKENAKN